MGHEDDVADLLRWLTPNPHLDGDQAQIAGMCQQVGVAMVETCENQAQLADGLRALLVAKDCFVRASMGPQAAARWHTYTKVDLRERYHDEQARTEATTPPGAGVDQPEGRQAGGQAGDGQAGLPAEEPAEAVRPSASVDGWSVVGGTDGARQFLARELGVADGGPEPPASAIEAALEVAAEADSGDYIIAAPDGGPDDEKPRTVFGKPVSRLYVGPVDP